MKNEVVVVVAAPDDDHIEPLPTYQSSPARQVLVLYTDFSAFGAKHILAALPTGLLPRTQLNQVQLVGWRSFMAVARDRSTIISKVNNFISGMRVDCVGEVC